MAQNYRLKRVIVRQEAIVRDNPERAHYRWELALLYKQAGRKKDALNSAMTASRLVEKSSRDKLESPLFDWCTANLLKYDGRYTEAEHYYERALSRFYAYRIEWEASGLNSQYDTKHMRTRIEKNLSEIKLVLDKDRPGEGWVWGHMPHIAIDWAKEAKKITQEERESISLKQEQLNDGETGGSGVHYDLARYYLHTGNPEKAIIQYLAQIEAEPDDEDASDDGYAWDDLGMAYLRAGRLKDAEKAFRKASELGVSSSATMAEDCLLAAAEYKSHKSKIKKQSR